ncbi:MAG: TonB dependent receptor [Hydrocarboniphaga sp.]|uniref:TonB-dependent receptor n=1 Tax=Hydrocarboniphaga sp. TaxID=2033016 RepID=UPI00261031C5|nr:TonB-dependent receptor [Hydrocarboniphaga sp.]MDB5970307.1 TonB dependent receptor [Hydrocarboniphaga sp.]
MSKNRSIRLNPRLNRHLLAIRRASTAATAGGVLSALMMAPALAQTAPTPEAAAQLVAEPAAEPAAEVPAAQAAAPEPAATSDEIEEIIVTAQKRQQSIKDVGMAITALSADALADLGVRDVGDLSKVEPSFTVSRAAYGTPVYSIRGVGYNEQSLAASPTVSVYVDEVPYAYPELTKAASLDIERVEVLKGPQGTLFGQNATGGAINYIAAKPTDTFESGVEFTYASFDATNLNGFFSGPLSDTLKYRVAFDMADGGAWQKSYTHGGELGDSDTKRARLLLDWQASDALRFRLNVNGWTDRSDAVAPQAININLQNPEVADEVQPIVNYPLAPRNARAADWNPDSPPNRDEAFFQTALRGEYTINEKTTLTSVSSFSKYSQDNLIENDGLALDSNAERMQGNVKSFAQELRLGGLFADDRANWVVGAAYSKDRTEENNTGILPDSSPAHLPENNFSDIYIHAQPTVENKAVFGNLEYKLLDTLSVHGGARYTKTDSRYTGCLAGDENFTALFRPFNPDLQAGDCITVNNFVPGEQHLSLNEDNVSWRVGADWKAIENTLLYATISKGYKSGSFPTLPATGVAQLQPATQESVLSYEAGIKTDLFERSVSITGAVFYYDYHDKQLRGRIDDPSGLFGVIDALVNVPKSNEKGAEATVIWKPLHGLTLNAGVTYLDSEVTGDFLTYDPYGSGEPSNFKGYSFPTIPKWSASTGGRYEWELSGGQIASLGADYHYQTKSEGAFVAGDEGKQLLKMDAYGVLDLRLGLAAADNTWSVAAFGKNVTDEYYWTQATKVYDTTVRYTGMPQVFGITFGYRFYGV